MSARAELLSLLESCKHEPDVASRLVLADWLEEHGDATDRERAALIRLEADAGERRGRPEFFKRQDEAWRRLRTRCAPFARDFPRSLVVRRWGGLLAADVSPGSLVRPACVAWAGTEAWAWVERVSLTPRATDMRSVADAPLLDTVPALDLDDARLPGPALDALRRRLRTVHHLGLSGARFGPEGLGPLVRSAEASDLRSLDLQGARLTAGDYEALADPRAMPALESLTLPEDNESRDETVAVLTAARRLRTLAVLTRLTEEALARLAASEHLAGLRSLVIPSETYRGLPGATFWPGLELLWLDGEPLGLADARALARAPATRLKLLCLRAVQNPAAVLSTLAASALCAGLGCLDLRYCPIGPAGAEALTRMPVGPPSLILAGCQLGDAGVEALTRWPGLAGCRVLSLPVNDITTKGIAALAASPYAGGLTALNVYSNPFRDRGVERLMSAEWVSGLEELVLGDDGRGERSVRALIRAARRMPRLKELHLGSGLLSPELRAAYRHVPCVV